MRNILEFVMRNRWTAALSAFFLSALSIMPLLQFPCLLLALSVVVLTCLSRGFSEGLLVGLWAALPVAAAAFAGPAELLSVQRLYLIPFPWAVACALLLRHSGSWPWTLAANTLCALLSALLLQLLAGGFLNDMAQGWREFLEQAMQDNEEALQNLQNMYTLNASRYAIMFSNGFAMLTVLCLILGRYWQAMLYKPGGLRSELHSLRLPLPLALTLAALWLGALLLIRYEGLGYDWRGYESMLALPLLVAGLALAHALAARWNIFFGLILLYAGLIFFPPLRTLLVLAAAADSQWNLRTRLGGAPPASPDGENDSADQLPKP